MINLIFNKTTSIFSSLRFFLNPPQKIEKKSTFDPESTRAKEGIAFQDRVFNELVKRFPNHGMQLTWDYFKKQNPSLSVYELACLEKEWGDITFVLNGQRMWIECCYAMGKKNTWFCEMKRIKFRGINKWYCWGKIEEPNNFLFVTSKTWNSYAKKCNLVKQGKKSFRVVSKSIIGPNLRAGKQGVEIFAQCIS